MKALVRARLLEGERELVWGLNARIVHLGIRTYIYGMPLPRNLDNVIESEIDAFFDGIQPVLRKMVAASQRVLSAPRLGSEVAMSDAKGQRASPTRRVPVIRNLESLP